MDTFFEKIQKLLLRGLFSLKKYPFLKATEEIPDQNFSNAWRKLSIFQKEEEEKIGWLFRKESSYMEDLVRISVAVFFPPLVSLVSIFFRKLSAGR